ncbi:MAG: insulinase family protein [Cyclobacteriaceae bacterium]
MKKLFILSFIVATAPIAFAQVDRTKAPKPAPAREIKIGDYQSFTLKNGLQVFVVENHKLPRVQFSLQLKHEAIREGEKAGYVSLAGDLIGTGTTNRKKAQLDEEVAFIGGVLNSSANGMFASSLTKHKEKLLELMTDVLYNPSLEQSELDKLKTQTISGITADKDDPNSIASNVRRVLVYGKDHPYGEIATEESVQSVTVEDCRAYYKKYFVPGNAYLVMVGDITLKEAKAVAEKYFAKWVAGKVEEQTFEKPQAPAKTYVALVDRPASVQSVLQVAYPVELGVGDPDVIKTRVMNQILGGSFSARMNQNLREKHGYTYGARTQLSSDAIIGNFNASTSVRNEVTDSALFEMISELKRITEEPVSNDELVSAKAYIAGAFGRSLESPQTIASFAVNTARYNLPKDYYSSYLQRLDAVTLADVQAVSKKYIRPDHAHLVVVGKGSEIADKLKQFGEVKYYDIHGTNYVPTKSELPAGLTADKVIASYVSALGGKQKLESVTSLSATYKANAMGMELQMKVQKKAPGKSVLEIGGNGMTLRKVVCDGKTVSMSAMGQKPPVDAELREKTLFESSIFPELSKTGAAYTLKGIEKVDGKEAYVLEVTLPSGGKSAVYFDRESGLKVQELETVKGPQGDITATTKYLDYKEVNGVKFPHTIAQNQGPMNFKFEVTELVLNPKIEDGVFKVE